MINDRVDVAIAAGADGAHIGQEDLPVAAARRLLGPGKILGVSCKTVQQARRAEAEGADYIGSGAGMPLLLFCLAMCGQHRRLRPPAQAVSQQPHTVLPACSCQAHSGSSDKFDLHNDRLRHAESELQKP